MTPEHRVKAILAEERKLLNDAITHWGFKAQMDMLAEESAELAVAAMHMTRKHKTKTPAEYFKSLESLAEEIADVMLTGRCIIQELGIEERVRLSYAEKLIRLKALLAEGAKH